jgi:hypothetical protein
LEVPYFDPAVPAARDELVGTSKHLKIDQREAGRDERERETERQRGRERQSERKRDKKVMVTRGDVINTYRCHDLISVAGEFV